MLKIEDTRIPDIRFHSEGYNWCQNSEVYIRYTFGVPFIGAPCHFLSLKGPPSSLSPTFPPPTCGPRYASFPLQRQSLLGLSHGKNAPGYLGDLLGMTSPTQLYNYIGITIKAIRIPPLKQPGFNGKFFFYVAQLLVFSSSCPCSSQEIGKYLQRPPTPLKRHLHGCGFKMLMFQGGTSYP